MVGGWKGFVGFVVGVVDVGVELVGEEWWEGNLLEEEFGRLDGKVVLGEEEEW